MNPSLIEDTPIVDGFTLSTSQLYLPTTYRSSVLAQMETLRRAHSFRLREYGAPVNSQETIPAFDQVEYQIVSLPGAYLWGAMFSVLATGDTEVVSILSAPGFIHIQVTDACTETPLFSDYTYGINLVPALGPDGGRSAGACRNPYLFPTPMLLGQPAHLDVELYNKGAVSITCQLILLVAEPMLSPFELQQLLKMRGLA